MTAPLAPGEIFAGYRIERVLGHGDRGAVYLAAHPRLPRFVALKVLSPVHSGDFEFSARFIRGAELVARLEHPAIVPVHDRGFERGCLWMAMGFVDGVDAGELIRRHPDGVDPRTAVHIVTEVAHGLDEAHRRGLLHRSVRPSNILLEPVAGQPDRVFISDFGIARQTTSTEALTEAGTLVTSLAHGAPELLAGGDLDGRVDVYALGCTLYELLTGTPPFPASSPAAAVRAHLTEPPPRPSARRPGLPLAMDAVIAVALAKDRDDRFASCGALAAAATAALDGTTMPVPRSRRRFGRRTAVALAVAVVAAVAVTATTLLVGQGNSPAPAATSVSASPNPVVADTRNAWGAYEFMVQTFPTLLPADPLSTGFQGVRCVVINSDGGRVEPTSTPGALAGMRCAGNGNPLDWLFIYCNTDRSPATLPADSEMSAVLGDQRWQRATGSGRLRWGNDIGLYGQPTGNMDIQFDNPAQSFCRMVAAGGATGQDLFDRWWPTAPL
ncbi:serine/threonine-protein kinase [Nocardia sp. NBC_00511]|uniref:serine/threonine-protein kinase n=1 Tax=Nocardia sp. NBC_00511 TaxID=2903591 RepID=UPI0030E4B0AA